MSADRRSDLLEPRVMTKAGATDVRVEILDGMIRERPAGGTAVLHDRIHVAVGTA